MKTTVSPFTTDTSSLPCLKISDISQELKQFPVVQESVSHGATNQRNMQLRLTATNEMAFFRALLNYGDIPAELLPYLPIYTMALTAVGTKRNGAGEFDELIRLYTGGIGASAFQTPSPSGKLCFYL